MKIHPGLKVSNLKFSYKLNRSIYLSKFDFSLFNKKTDTFFISILVYVDDLVLAFKKLSAWHNSHKDYYGYYF